MVSFGGISAPTGWLLCDGALVSRTVYAALFAIIGTDYGAGDGSTTFAVPDLRGRVAVGFAVSGGHVDVSTLGNSESITSANRRPKHRHTAHSHTVGLTAQYSGAAPAGYGGWGGFLEKGSNANNEVITVGTSNADGGSGNSNDSVDAPAYLVLNHIIKI